jgi:hypothetical protein
MEDLKMNQKFRKKWLEWALGFIQRDLLKVSTNEKHRLIPEVFFFSSTWLLSEEWNLFTKRKPLSHDQFLEWERAIPGIQEVLREFLKTITVTPQSTFEGYTLPDTISRVSLQGRYTVKGKKLIGQWIDSQGRLIGEGPYVVPRWGYKICFKIQSVPKNYAPGPHWAVFNLASLMNDVEGYVFGKCKECGAYFLNLSRREKKFCNHWCASRASARSRIERLKKDPKKYKAYLKRQAKAMRENYIRERLMKGKKVRHRRKV